MTDRKVLGIMARDALKWPPLILLITLACYFIGEFALAPSAPVPALPIEKVIVGYMYLMTGVFILMAGLLAILFIASLILSIYGDLKSWHQSAVERAGNNGVVDHEQ